MATIAIAVALLLAVAPGGLAQDMQAAPSSSDTVTDAKVNQPSAAADAVITIHGLCGSDKAESGTASCTTIITRQEFETLLNAMNVTNKAVTPEMRRNLAETYADYLIMERPAAQAKLDDTPQFAEVMRWWRLRTLAEMYRGGLEARFAQPSTDEVHAYYAEHLRSFDRIRVERIVVPRGRTRTDEEKRIDEKALKIADAAHERVVKGDDPAVVQKDIFAQLKLDGTPLTDLGRVARSNFPSNEADELFALEPGQVSKVEKEASYAIYKITTKETLTEESQKSEIAREIARHKFADAMRAVNQSAQPEFNDAYLGPHVAPAAQAGMINPHQ